MLKYYIVDYSQQKILFDNAFDRAKDAVFFLRKHNMLLQRRNRLTSRQNIRIMTENDIRKWRQVFVFDTETIIGYNGGKLDTLSIPGNIDEATVKAIGANVFAGLELTNLVLPSTVTNIGVGAFKQNNLTYLSLANVGIIDDNAFAENNITHVVIGSNTQIASATSMGNFGEAFLKVYCEVNEGGNGRFAGTYVYSNNAWKLQG
jgi:hypothetical protein